MQQANPFPFSLAYGSFESDFRLLMYSDCLFVSYNVYASENVGVLRLDIIAYFSI